MERGEENVKRGSLQAYSNGPQRILYPFWTRERFSRLHASSYAKHSLIPPILGANMLYSVAEIKL